MAPLRLNREKATGKNIFILIELLGIKRVLNRRSRGGSLGQGSSYFEELTWETKV
jgi:hypothetical protein